MAQFGAHIAFLAATALALIDIFKEQTFEIVRSDHSRCKYES
jgi:hypothetical protein